MTSERDPQQQERLNWLVALARGAVDERLRNAGGEGGLANLILGVGQRVVNPAPRRRLFVPLGAGFAVAGLVLVIVGATRLRAPSPALLSYAVENEPAAPTTLMPAAPATTARDGHGATTGARVAEAATSSQYHFSDGTTIAAPSGTAVDVEAVDNKRPRVRINGRPARVRVVHRPDTRWIFEAGPFEVLVTGTAFDLGWNAAPQVLSLDLIEGAVTLRGPRLPEGGVPVLAGQHVEVSLATGSLTVRAAGAAPAQPQTPPPPLDEAPISGATPAPAPSVPAPAASRRAGAVSWRGLVGRGDFDGVVKAARRRSIDDCELRCSAEDLRALGDAARYSNRSALAERAFVALRARFAGTTDGTAAAYLLGRTYESKHNWSGAERLYQQYLSEAPSGQFAVEAASGRARVAARR
ncbi:MAG TPA: tetratricopeptide repeat protein [Polyangia bacterium]|nr:tetratricopeptide repeat protein [Polyangia bacterium]